MKKNMCFYISIFILLCLIGIILRFLSLDIPLYDDAAGIASIGEYHDVIYANLVECSHGPINLIFFFIGMKLFSASTIGLRFTLLLLSIIYLIILFFFTKIIFGIKTACYAIILSLFTFFAFFDYFIVETDGVIHGIFSIITFFSLYLFFESKNNSKKMIKGRYFLKNIFENGSIFWFFVSVLSYVSLVSMKQRTGLLIIPIFLYVWYTTRELKKSIFFCAIYIFSAVIAIILMFFSYFLIYGDMAPSLIKIDISTNHISPDIFYKLTHLSMFIPLLVALSPLFLMLPLFSLKKFKKEYFIFYSWLTVIIAYLILIPSKLIFVRYVAGFLLPPLTVLSAESIAKEKLKKSAIIWIIIFTAILSSILIFINNTIPSDYWFFQTEFGPVIKVWQPLIYTIFPFAFLLSILLWIKEKSSIRVYIFSLFIILSLSFNIMMITDNMIDRTHNKLIEELKEYAEEHKDELGQIYSWNEDIAFYIGNIGFYIVSEDEKDSGSMFDSDKYLREYSRSIGYGQQGYIDLNLPLELIEEHISTKGGTVFLLNHPRKYIEASALTKKVMVIIKKYCNKEEEKIYKTGSLVIYKCQPSSSK